MKKILVIEDDATIRSGIVELLTFEGYEILEAENGLVGLRKAFQFFPDLILCDIMMPEVNGHEVLEIIRAKETVNLTPFVFMTALSDSKDVRSGMVLGADDYITKPFTLEELLNAIQTQLKKSEQFKEHTQTALNELRSKIISVLPHELRTPLNGIMGLSQLLKDSPDKMDVSEVKEIGEGIYQSSLRLYRLIQNYLTYAQLDNGIYYPLVESPLSNSRELVQNISEMIAANYKRSSDLNLHLEEGSVHISQPEFEKIVEELVDNAFKFSTSGSPVTVTCGVLDTNFQLKIEDKGKGIAQGDIPKIGAYMQFERIKYEQQGSGLGLIISKRLVEMFKGELNVESANGKGTSISILLPANN